MRPNKLTHLVASLFLWLVVGSLYAQVNVRVGYNIGYFTPSIHHKIYQQFNDDRPWLTKHFKDFQTINGLQLGVRYRIDDWIALEGTWYNQFHRQSAEGPDPATNKNFNRSSGFQLSTLGLGFENFAGPISWGASINYDAFRFNTKATGEDRPTVFNDFGWSSHFFIAYNIEANDIMRLSIRPYAHLAWHRVDLSSFHQRINPSADIPSNLEEDYSTFGLMLIIYNGN